MLHTGHHIFSQNSEWILIHVHRKSISIMDIFGFDYLLSLTLQSVKPDYKSMNSFPFSYCYLDKNPARIFELKSDRIQFFGLCFLSRNWLKNWIEFLDKNTAWNFQAFYSKDNPIRKNPKLISSFDERKLKSILNFVTKYDDQCAPAALREKRSW